MRETSVMKEVIKGSHRPVKAIVAGITTAAMMAVFPMAGSTANADVTADASQTTEKLDIAESGLPSKTAPFDQTVAYFLWPYQWGQQNVGTAEAPKLSTLMVDRSSTTDVNQTEKAGGNSASDPAPADLGPVEAGEYGWKGPGVRPTEPNLKSLDNQIKLVKESGFTYVKTSYLISPLNVKNFPCDQSVPGNCQPSTELPDQIIEHILAAGLKPVVYFSQGNPDPKAVTNPNPDEVYKTVPSFTKQQVKDTIAHAIQTFAGKGVIWEAFNEPDSEEHWPGGGNVAEAKKQWIELDQFIGDTIQKYDNGAAYVYGNFSKPDNLKNYQTEMKAAHATATSGHGYWVGTPENVSGPVLGDWDYMDSEFGCSAQGTETSWSCGFAGIPKDSELQGIWLSRMLISKDIRGVSLSSPYRMVGYDSFSICEDNDPAHPGDVKTTPAYDMIKEIALALKGYRYVDGTFKNDNGVYRVEYRNDDGAKKLVYWTADVPTMDNKSNAKRFSVEMNGSTVNLTATAKPQTYDEPTASHQASLTNLTAWKDVNGEVIQAHGGSVLKDGDTFYWVGQGAPDNVATGYTGNGGVFKNQWLYTTINMYKSTDLVNWEFANEVTSIDDANAAAYCSGNAEGLTSKVLDWNSSDPTIKALVEKHPQYKTNPTLGCKIERPHILKNDKTSKYLIWAHWEGTVGYGSSQLIAFESNTVDGKYQPLAWTNGDGSKVESGHAQPVVKVDGKLTPVASRDLSAWQDPDTGAGYIISSTERVHLFKLNDDFTGIDPDGSYELPNISYREAPSLFKENGRYYMITSGQDYWDPTQTEYATTTNLSDPNSWSKLTELQSKSEARKNWGNQDASKRTYLGQPTYVLQYQDSNGRPAVVLLADDWNPLKKPTADVDTTKANYVMTPVTRYNDGTITVDHAASITPMQSGMAVQQKPSHPENGWDADKQHWYDNGVMARNHAFYDPDSDAWYWADGDGSIAANKDVFIPKDETDRTQGKWVRFREDRTMVKGEDFKDGGWYYFDPVTGEMAKGIAYVPSHGGKWAYYDPVTGRMQYGEQYVSYDKAHTGWYYFDPVTGAMAHGTTFLPANGGKWVYYDWITGQMVHGEAYLSYDKAHTGWYYFDPVTGAMAHGDVFLRSNGGKWVRYDDVTGKMVKGLDHRYGSWYYFLPSTGAMQKGNVYVPEWNAWHRFDPTTGRG